MNGANVFMFTLREIPDSINRLLAKNNLQLDSIDLFIFHQASSIVIDSITESLNLPKEKVFKNFKNIGNTISSSIPICLADLISSKKIIVGV